MVGLAFLPTQVILRFLHRAEHRGNALAAVWLDSDSDTRPCNWMLRGELFVIFTNFEASILYGRHRICIFWLFDFSRHRNWLRMYGFSSFNPHNSKKGESGPQKYCGDCSISLLGCGFFYDVFWIFHSTFQLPLVMDIYIPKLGNEKKYRCKPTLVTACVLIHQDSLVTNKRNEFQNHRHHQ